MKPETENTEPESTGAAAGEDAAEAAADAAANDAGAPDALATAQAEAADLKDRLLRAAAEMENMRKRNERQLEDAHKYAVTGFARDVLAVADNLQRALAAVPEERRAEHDLVQNLLGGVEAVEKELLTILEKHNISRIEPLGEPFDPNRHEAVFEVPGSDYPDGIVAQVLQPGYMLNDRLLRPAMVGVAKGGAAAAGGVDTTA
ncbi:MAG: nucleotide exchange factor GrpE [Alphaproteobacteria bacterium]|jgi:molecular chaperone GrpE